MEDLGIFLHDWGLSECCVWSFLLWGGFRTVLQAGGRVFRVKGDGW